MKKKPVKSFIFMRNLPCYFATVQCIPVLRHWCYNPKEIEGKKQSLFSWSVVEKSRLRTPLLLQKKQTWTSLFIAFKSKVGLRSMAFLCKKIFSYKEAINQNSEMHQQIHVKLLCKICKALNHLMFQFCLPLWPVWGLFVQKSYACKNISNVLFCHKNHH